jgi:hypothetical protein
MENNIINSETEYVHMKFNHPNMKNLKFNQHFLDKVIGEGKKLGSFSIENSEQAIVAPIHGKIRKMDLEDREIIIEPCKHETRYLNLCTECNFDFKKSEAHKTLHSNKFVMFSTDVAFSAEVILLINPYRELRRKKDLHCRNY